MYILYTTVRIKSILNRYKEEGGNLDTLKILAAGSDSEKALMLEASKFNQVITNAYEEKAPHKICSYIYELANAFNRFYHETKILAEEDQAKKESYLALLMLVKIFWKHVSICWDLKHRKECKRDFRKEEQL